MLCFSSSSLKIKYLDISVSHKPKLSFLKTTGWRKCQTWKMSDVSKNVCACDRDQKDSSIIIFLARINVCHRQLIILYNCTWKQWSRITLQPNCSIIQDIQLNSDSVLLFQANTHPHDLYHLSCTLSFNFTYSVYHHKNHMPAKVTHKILLQLHSESP